MQLTNLSVNLFIVPGAPLPAGAEIVGDKAVKDNAHPIGAVLLYFRRTGMYSLFNADGLSSCDQTAAKAIHQAVLNSQTKSERLYIRLTPELKAQLQDAADAENRTISNYIEHLIKQALAKGD